MFLRKFLRAFAAFLFSTALVIAIGSYTFIEILKPTVLKQIFSQGAALQTEKIFNDALQACQNRETIDLQLGGETVNLNCNELRSGGKQVLTSTLTEKLFNTIYYQKYDCNFLQCLSQPGPERFTVIFSEQANIFFNRILFYSSISTALFAVLLFVSYETYVERLKGFGKIFLWTGVPFLVFAFLLDRITSLFLPAAFIEAFGEFSLSLPTNIQNIFIAITVVGGILYATGILLERKQPTKRKKTKI